jgi:hypothetical protein
VLKRNQPDDGERNGKKRALGPARRNEEKRCKRRGEAARCGFPFPRRALRLAEISNSPTPIVRPGSERASVVSVARLSVRKSGRERRIELK